MTLKGQMALAIIRAILAQPEKFSRGLAEAAVRFDRFWAGSERGSMVPGTFTSGQQYWSQPDNIDRFPQHSQSWQAVQELLPDDLAERINARKD